MGGWVGRGGRREGRGDSGGGAAAGGGAECLSIPISEEAEHLGV